jgi:hypothetical protein
MATLSVVAVVAAAGAIGAPVAASSTAKPGTPEVHLSASTKSPGYIVCTAVSSEGPKYHGWVLATKINATIQATNLAKSRCMQIGNITRSQCVIAQCIRESHPPTG